MPCFVVGQGAPTGLLPGTGVVDTFGASETGGQGRLARGGEGGRPRLVTDGRWSEQVTAVLAVRPGRTVDEDELEAHCRRHLAGYKVPRRWVWVEECRRLPTGKPDYRWARAVAG